jgi:hypothetical protein
MSTVQLSGPQTSEGDFGLLGKGSELSPALAPLDPAPPEHQPPLNIWLLGPGPAGKTHSLSYPTLGRKEVDIFLSTLVDQCGGVILCRDARTNP